MNTLLRNEPRVGGRLASIGPENQGKTTGGPQENELRRPHMLVVGSAAHEAATARVFLSQPIIQKVVMSCVAASRQRNRAATGMPATTHVHSTTCGVQGTGQSPEVCAFHTVQVLIWRDQVRPVPRHKWFREIALRSIDLEFESHWSAPLRDAPPHAQSWLRHGRNPP
jgi:hypothetical protein